MEKERSKHRNLVFGEAARSWGFPSRATAEPEGIKKSAHGNGYGREAVHTLVNWSKKNINIDYFIYPVDRRNIASCKIPESLGGEVVEEFKAETSTSKILDKVVYKID